MKKNVIALMALFSLALFSCEKNQIIESELTNSKTVSDGVSVVNGRVVFKDKESYVKTFFEVGKLSFEKQQQWVENLGIITLGKVIDDSKEKNEYIEKMREASLPPPLFNIMNAKGEFQIGTELIWLDGSTQHFAKDENTLAAIKNGTSKSKTFFEITSKTINNNLANARVSLNGNAGDARNQLQYTLGSFQFKHVYAIRQFNMPTVGTNAYLEIKFEYSKPSWSGWYSAGETRNISYNITVKAQNMFQTVTNSFSDNVPAYKDTKPYGRLIYGISAPGTFTVDYDITGTIYQKALDIAGHTPYTATGTLW